MRTLMIFFSLVMMVSCTNDFNISTKNDLIGRWDIYQFEVDGDLKTYQTVYHNGPMYFTINDSEHFTFAYYSGIWDLDNNKLTLNWTYNYLGIRYYTILDYQDDILVMESVVKNEGLYQEVGKLFGIGSGEEFKLKEYFRRN